MLISTNITTPIELGLSQDALRSYLRFDHYWQSI